MKTLKKFAPRAAFRAARAGRRSAFTLIEMLVALALFGMLFSAVVVVLVQVSSTWASEADDPQIDRHVDGLDRFIRSIFVESGAAGVKAPTSTQISDENAFLSVVPPSDLPWIALIAQDGGAIEGRLSMGKDNDGLRLYWNTARERLVKRIQPHSMLLSSWVTAARVYVYDADGKTWTESVPGTQTTGSAGAGSATSFRVLQLDIVHQGQSRTLRIPIPRTEQ